METLRDFVAALLQEEGAVVESEGTDNLAVLSPAALRHAMGWSEFARLGFGPDVGGDAVRVGLEGDWLEKFGGLVGDRGQWAERQLALAEPRPVPGAPERILEHALELPNATWRFQKMTPAWTRCLILACRYTAISDEKREGLLWLSLNLGTGATLGDLVFRLRTLLAEADEWQPPEASLLEQAGPRWTTAALARRIQPMLDHLVRQELAPFVGAMRRRLERDRDRVHAYHDDLRALALKRAAALEGVAGEKAEADRLRERARIAAIEGEYGAKLEDLRHNYALSVSVTGVQALELLVPVQRLEILIKRRKNERTIALDWHPALRQAEPPLCEWGLGLGRTRLVCDASLHLTEAAGQELCPACSSRWCRACHPQSCPRCGTAQTSDSVGAGNLSGRTA